MTDTNTAAGSEEHGLRRGVLTLFDPAVMGVAGVAPAYSIAASTATLFGAVALGGPAALLYCGIAMFGIVWAFNYLGRVETNSGASYTWVRNALHPALGYIAGWALVVSALIFMVAGSFPAGSITLGLFSTSLANNTLAVTILGSVFFLIMVGAVAAGVTITAKLQVIMSTVELALLLLFAALMLLHGHNAHAFSWSWFSPGIFHGSSGFFAGALVAAFYYWGWDVTANLNEETKGSKVTPGIGGIIGVLVVFALFEVFTVGSNLVLSAKDINNNSGDILGVLGQIVWPGLGGKLIVVAVILSTVATLETTIIQVTRTMFSMGRDGTLPKVLGKVHPKWRTPYIATFVVAVISVGLFVGSNYIGSIGNILTDAINAIGLQIAIYYSLAGLSVVILYRKQITKSISNFIFMGLWPLSGAVFMAIMFVKTIPGLNQTTLIVGLGAMALGLIPMAIYWAKGRPYFNMPTQQERLAPTEEELATI
ncbi:Amino acid transporter [Ferrithrix thermotolerans DSM 19514]|uniref:Amino acid transporter n=1 Tax=Ferrithrix thermotolerans DSM 19514 TaxID=1121881 RepID=A0A1M4UBZ7_9ACTN|nr:APC family permease [Ferrithrix thermotolerans]SHE54176.1 Amino acid transporter [Ferrithrix thermotolerans DSM 19514]